MGNMVVCVIPGRDCMCVVVHTTMVGGPAPPCQEGTSCGKQQRMASYLHFWRYSERKPPLLTGVCCPFAGSTRRVQEQSPSFECSVTPATRSSRSLGRAIVRRRRTC